jgi:hypothetical protein
VKYLAWLIGTLAFLLFAVALVSGTEAEALAIPCTSVVALAIGMLYTLDLLEHRQR